MSENFLKLIVVLIAIISFSSAGCRKNNPFDLAPVSGIVTVDGQPTPGIVVVFTPVATDKTAIVGPFSSAITDADGKFTLKSKQGDFGAVIGSHSVSCQYRSYDPEAVANLKQKIQQARQSGGDVAAAKAALTKAQQQRAIPERYSGIRVTVEKDGLANHKFDLTSE